jgi:hypothetical protein
MVTVFDLTAKSTIPIGRACALGHLLTARKPPSDELPEVDPDPRGDLGAPHLIEV